jgi:hypothetical protein
MQNCTCKEGKLHGKKASNLYKNLEKERRTTKTQKKEDKWSRT